MKFILEYKSYYKINDVVLVKYWYNRMITPVKIIDKIGNKFIVSHDVTGSRIQNAPNESIKSSDIISIFRPN